MTNIEKLTNNTYKLTVKDKHIDTGNLLYIESLAKQLGLIDVEFGFEQLREHGHTIIDFGINGSFIVTMNGTKYEN